MKASEFTIHIERLCRVLEAAGKRGIAKTLRASLGMFKGYGNKQVGQMLTSAPIKKLNCENGSTEIRFMLPTLTACDDLFAGFAKQGFKNDFSKFLDFMRSKESANVSSLVESVQSALKPSQGSTSQRARPKLDKDQIEDLVQQLRNVIGKREVFDQVFDQLKIADLAAANAVAVARGIDSKTPSKSSKAAAIKRIKDRHKELVDYGSKSKSMPGRSAA